MRMMEIKKEKIQTPFQESLKKILSNKQCIHQRGLDRNAF